MSERTPRVFRYVVRWDAGTAPHPFDGILTLAICKPRIRASAQVGDWVMGFRRRCPGEVLYVMQVTERLSFSEYWDDARFAGRRPRCTPFPDNLYRPATGGAMVQEPNHVHGTDSATTDLGGRHVLASERFWYFGSNSVPLPNELLHLVHAGRGHAVNKNSRPEDVACLQTFLAAWPKGMHGRPIDEASTLAAAERWKLAQETRSGCTA